MSIELLAARAQVLQTEIQRAKQNVNTATEQLEQSKAHLNMVSGHLNEVAFLMGELQKKDSSPEELTEAINRNPIVEPDSKEQDNGHTIIENA